MYVETSLAQLSPAQLKKLHSGKPVRVKHGATHKVQVLPAQHKKLMRAHMKGKGMCLTCPMMGGAGVTQRQKGGALAEKGQPYLVNKTISPIKQAASERAVRAIEGSGVMGLPTSSADVKSMKRAAKNPEKFVKALGEKLKVAQAAVKKEMKEPMSFASHLARGEPYVLPDGTAPLSVQAIKRGKPLGGKGGLTQRLKGEGAVNRRKKAGLYLKGIESVYDSIAKRLKPVAKPIGKALGERGAEYIREYDNPQLQYKGYLDLLQEELPQTIQAMRGQPQYEFPPPPVQAYPVEEDVKPYEEVKWYYGSGGVTQRQKGSAKKGSPEMKAKMAALRAMKGKAQPKAAPKTTGKGSPEMKAKMAALRSMRGKAKGGALYPAGY